MRPLDAAARFFREHGIHDARVTCALSGGADSVVLLHCLMQLRERFSLSVDAVHVQHGLRGEESDRDEAFCRTLCASHGIALTVQAVDAAGTAGARGMSLETAARECRYAVFAQFPCVATAHTASDLTETVLLHRARGTGLRGLCGIPTERPGVIRPLLHSTRAEVEAYAAQEGLAFVTDSTNADVRFSRNYMRQCVIPPLRERYPAIERSITAMTQLLREEEDYLTQQADAAYRAALQPDGSLTGLGSLHPAMQRRVIRRFLAAHGLHDASAQVLAVQALLQGGGRLEPERDGRWICVSRDTLCLVTPGAPEETVLQMGDNRVFPGLTVRAALVTREDPQEFSRIHTMFANSVLDYDIIKGCAVLHGRRPGLRMRPADRAHTVQIKKWLGTLPPRERPFVHFLSDD